MGIMSKSDVFFSGESSAFCLDSYARLVFN